MIVLFIVFFRIWSNYCVLASYARTQMSSTLTCSMLSSSLLMSQVFFILLCLEEDGATVDMLALGFGHQLGTRLWAEVSVISLLLQRVQEQGVVLLRLHLLQTQTEASRTSSGGEASTTVQVEKHLQQFRWRSFRNISGGEASGTGGLGFVVVKVRMKAGLRKGEGWLRGG